MTFKRYLAVGLGILLLASCSSSEKPQKQAASRKAAAQRPTAGEKAEVPGKAPDKDGSETKTSTVAADPASEDPPAEPSKVTVGQKAPSFTLKDQEGKDRSLDELLKEGQVALVFYRSADW